MSGHARNHGLTSSHNVQTLARRAYSDKMSPETSMKLLMYAMEKSSLPEYVIHQLHVLATTCDTARSFLGLYFDGHPASKNAASEYCNTVLRNGSKIVDYIPLYTKHTKFTTTHNSDRNIYMYQDELKQSLAVHIRLKDLSKHIVSDPKKMKKMSSFTLAALIVAQPDTWDNVFPHVKQNCYGYLTANMKDFHTKVDLTKLAKTTISDMAYERPSIAWDKDFPVEKIDKDYVWSKLISANPDKAHEAYLKRLKSAEKVSKTEFRTVSSRFGVFNVTPEIAHICPLSAKELILHAGRNSKRIILEDGLAELLEADLLSEFLFGTEKNSTILKNKLKQVKGDVDEA